MDERFNIFVTRVLEAEGYLSDDVNDNGGLTKYGISQRAYPNLDIKNITLDDAKNIYYNDYFLKYRFNEVENDNIALNYLILLLIWVEKLLLHLYKKL